MGDKFKQDVKAMIEKVVGEDHDWMVEDFEAYYDMLEAGEIDVFVLEDIDFSVIEQDAIPEEILERIVREWYAENEEMWER